jgi:hypothetical protein
VKIPEHCEAYLERTARRLSARGTSTTPESLLAALVEIAIADEAVFDPEDLSAPMSPTRRAIVQAEGTARSVRLGPDEVIRHLVAQAAAAGREYSSQ